MKARSLQDLGTLKKALAQREAQAEAERQRRLEQERQAQAERERQARIILGQAEMDIAEKFSEAARTYEAQPVALHLRAMNMLYEAIKEKGSMVIVPSSAVETMGLGGMLATTTLGNNTPKPSPQGDVLK